MKLKAILVTVVPAVVVVIIALFAFRETPLPEIPQSKRCAEMCRRRDSGSIRIPPNASKSVVRKVLGDPQNTDQDGEVWIWLSDWEGYEKSGLSRDWRTMSQNSGGHDGLWIAFDAQGRVRTPLWSLSAADPSASNVNLNVKSNVR